MFVSLENRTPAPTLTAEQQTLTAERILRELARRAQGDFLVSHFLGNHRNVGLLYSALTRIVEVCARQGRMSFPMPCPEGSAATKGWSKALGNFKSWKDAPVGFQLLWVPGTQDTGEPPLPDAEQVTLYLEKVQKGFAARNARQADTALMALIGYVNSHGRREVAVDVPDMSDFAVFLVKRIVALGETFWFSFGPAEVVTRKGRPPEALARKRIRTERDRKAQAERDGRPRPGQLGNEAGLLKRGCMRMARVGMTGRSTKA